MQQIRKYHVKRLTTEIPLAYSFHNNRYANLATKVAVGKGYLTERNQKQNDSINKKPYSKTILPPIEINVTHLKEALVSNRLNTPAERKYTTNPEVCKIRTRKCSILKNAKLNPVFELCTYRRKL